MSRYCWNRAHPWHASELLSFLVGLRTYQNFGSYRHFEEQSCLRFLGQSSSLSYIFHGFGLLADPFRSHVSRSLFKGLPWFLPPAGEKYFITLGNLFRGILFTCCIELLLYSSDLSKIGVIFNSFAICAFVLQSVQAYPGILLLYFIAAAFILLGQAVQKEWLLDHKDEGSTVLPNFGNYLAVEVQ